MAVSKRIRYEVLRRDNHTCRYCGGSAPDVVLTVDHVVPIALGGSDDPSNLVAACKDCNAGKTSTSPDGPLVADVAQDAVRWAVAMREAANILDAQRAMRDSYVEEFDKAWAAWSFGGAMRRPIPRPDNWVASIHQFYAAGLSIEELTDAVAIAGRADRVTVDEMWRYMCGVAWRKVAELQEIAKSVAVTGLEDD